MKGKERIINCLQLKNTDRIPWVPFVGIHGAKLIHVEGDEYLRSSDLIVEGVEKSIQLYEPDGIPVTFDLQIEAEALGCELAWSKDNPPMVTSHPLANGKTLGDMKIPDRNASRIPIC